MSTLYPVMVTHGFRFLGNNFNPAHAHAPLLNAMYIWYKWFIMYRFKLLTLHNFRNPMKSHDHFKNNFQPLLQMVIYFNSSNADKDKSSLNFMLISYVSKLLSKIF